MRQDVETRRQVMLHFAISSLLALTLIHRFLVERQASSVQDDDRKMTISVTVNVFYSLAAELLHVLILPISIELHMAYYVCNQVKDSL